MSNADLSLIIFTAVSIIIGLILHYRNGGKKELIYAIKILFGLAWMMLFWGFVFYGACNGGHL